MKVNKTFRLEQELIDELKARAEADHRTFTNLVISILEEWRKQESKTA